MRWKQVSSANAQLAGNPEPNVTAWDLGEVFDQ